MANRVALNRLTVLVVDDSPPVRGAVRAMLEGFGLGHVVEAGNGREALSVARHAGPDIVLTDWLMPQMDGRDLTLALRRGEGAFNPYIPVIMMTAYPNHSVVTRARDAGVTEFCVKPLAPAILMTRLTAVLERPRPFVRTAEYFGPDRRRVQLPYEGADRRQEPYEAPADRRRAPRRGVDIATSEDPMDQAG